MCVQMGLTWCVCLSTTSKHIVGVALCCPSIHQLFVGLNRNIIPRWIKGSATKTNICVNIVPNNRSIYSSAGPTTNRTPIPIDGARETHTHTQIKYIGFTCSVQCVLVHVCVRLSVFVVSHSDSMRARVFVRYVQWFLLLLVLFVDYLRPARDER